jgi:hypothetical protein
MNTKTAAAMVDILTEELPPITLRELEVRALREEEKEMAARLLEQEHYLGKGQAVGKTLCQVVHYHGRWVALLEWGPASLKLADRDEWIGWSDQQRAERINFVVQNRRFLVLAATRMPNLASRALALATNALALQWEERHGYRPLLAETFTDIEQFEGTCYKAAGWIPCGFTKGFKRHRADFYQKHGRPKKLWLKTLSRNTGVILRAMDMPESYQAGLSRQSPERALPLRKAQIDSLREAFRQVDEGIPGFPWDFSNAFSAGVCEEPSLYEASEAIGGRSGSAPCPHPHPVSFKVPPNQVSMGFEGNRMPADQDRNPTEIPEEP